MFGMVLDVIVHKSSISVRVDGGGKVRNVSIIGMLENNPEPTTDKEGMETLLMAVSMVGMTWSSKGSPCGS